MIHTYTMALLHALVDLNAELDFHQYQLKAAIQYVAYTQPTVNKSGLQTRPCRIVRTHATTHVLGKGHSTRTPRPLPPPIPPATHFTPYDV